MRLPAPVVYVVLPLLLIGWAALALRPDALSLQHAHVAHPVGLHGTSERAAAENPRRAPDVLWTLSSALPDARVSVVRSGKVEPCTKGSAGRHQCSEADWAFVGPYGDAMGGESRGCVWMHPVGDNVATRIEFDEVPFGGRVDAAVGLMDGAGQGGDVHVTVSSGKEDLLRTVVSRDGAPTRNEASTADRNGTVGPLRVELYARETKWRLACVEVWTRSAGVAASRDGRPQAPSRLLRYP